MEEVPGSLVLNFLPEQLKNKNSPSTPLSPFLSLWTGTRIEIMAVPEVGILLP